MVYSLFDCNGIALDIKLDKIFKFKKYGFYIEIGANDGLTQSNTAYFEKEMGWKGILIEPCKKMYDLCVINRPNSICINCACVSNDYNEQYINGDFISGSLMASVNSDRVEKNKEKLCSVKAETLTTILDNNKIDSIDFISIDTEGYEYNILKGINLNKYRPKYMLIEIYKKDYNNILNYLKKYNYKLYSNFTNYNKKQNIKWDGTHNDYLFIDNEIN